MNKIVFCERCNKIIKDKNFVTTSNDSKSYHKTCFTCNSCGFNLTGQDYYPKQGSIYCQKCVRRLFGAKCDVCGRKIEGSFISQRNKKFHKECKECNICQKPLTGKYILTNKGELCVQCNEEHQSKCAKCKLPIKGAFFNVFGKDWHKQCFTCAKCNFMFDGSYQTFENKPYHSNCLKLIKMMERTES